MPVWCSTWVGYVYNRKYQSCLKENCVEKYSSLYCCNVCEKKFYCIETSLLVKQIQGPVLQKIYARNSFLTVVS
jgi:hypothetical protein